MCIEENIAGVLENGVGARNKMVIMYNSNCSGKNTSSYTSQKIAHKRTEFGQKSIKFARQKRIF